MWPEVVEIDLPASTIRGPTAQPRAIASRSASVLPLSPRLRTVVKPAASVFRAFHSVS